MDTVDAPSAVPSEAEALFAEALRLSEEGKVISLDGVDPALAREVELILQSDAQLRALAQADDDATNESAEASAGETQRGSAADGTETSPRQNVSDPSGVPGDVTVVGKFELLEFIAHGGTSVVFRARQRNLNRIVALKLVLPRDEADDQAVQRLQTEAESLIRLRHPNIVAVYEFGSQDGWWYLATDFIEGSTLAGELGERTYPPRKAAQIVLTLAQTIEFAHSRGVLHRDLKPSNVLVDREGGVWLADFGLAKQVDVDCELTETGQILGTPGYMAPEQAAGRLDDVGRGTDIYGLGGVLYALLTGSPPFRGVDVVDTLMKVRSEDVQPVRTLSPQVPIDLDTICLKCLRKSVHDRYATAADLAEDLQRFLSGRPVRARRITVAERLVRWSRRNPFKATSLASLLLLVVVVFLGGLYHGVAVDQLNAKLITRNAELIRAATIADELRRQANSSALASRQLAYASDMSLACEALESSNMQRLRAILDRQLPGEGEADVRDFTWRMLNRTLHRPTAVIGEIDADIYDARFSPDGALLAVAGADDRLRLIDAATDRLLRFWECHQGEVNGVAFHPRQPWVATAGDDGTVKVWDINDGTLIRTFDVLGGEKCYVACFSPDGGRLVVCGQVPFAELWDVETGSRRHTFAGGHRRSIEALDISADGTLLSTVSSDTIHTVWSLETLAVLWAVSGGVGPVERHVMASELRVDVQHRPSMQNRLMSTQFSSDSDWIVTGGLDGGLHVWGARTGKFRGSVRRPDGVQRVAVSASGKIAASERGGVVTLWNLVRGGNGREVNLEQTAIWKVRSDRVYGLDWSRDESSIVTGTEQGRIERWGTTLVPAVTRRGMPLLGSEWNEQALVTIPGRAAALVATVEGVFEWDVPSDTFHLLPSSNGQSFTACDLASEGQTVWAARDDGMLLKSNRKGTEARSLLLERVPDRRFAVRALSTPSEALVLSSHRLERIDIERGDRSTVLEDCDSFECAPSRELLAVGRVGTDALELYDFSSLKRRWRCEAHSTTITSLAFDPTEQFVASGGRDRRIVVTRVADGTVLYRRESLPTAVTGLGFSPDSRILAAAFDDGAIRLYQAMTGRELMTVNTDAERAYTVRFTADGNWLLAIVSDEGPNRAFELIAFDGRRVEGEAALPE